MTLLSLSNEMRAGLTLLPVIMCLAAFAGIIRAALNKKYGFAIALLLPLAASFSQWQTIYGIYLYTKKGSEIPYIQNLSRCPLWLWIIISAATLVLTFAVLEASRRFSKNNLTPAAIRLCTDKMPCGICLFSGDGLVVFSNACMNRLCIDITDAPLLDGKAFAALTEGKIINIGDRMWQFNCRDILLGGKSLYEMTAYDISEIYSKTKELKRNNEHLRRLADELKEYGMSIDETVRREEILRAKVNIHDEMNRLMLSTATADVNDAGAIDSNFAMWEQNALFLCREADNSSSEESRERLIKLAGILGIELISQGIQPEELNDRQRELFYTAAGEALANAAKHAGAKRMRICIKRKEEDISFIFENDGRVRPGETVFTGGLSNLRRLALRQGGELCAEKDGTFTLTLRIKNI